MRIKHFLLSLLAGAGMMWPFFSQAQPRASVLFGRKYLNGESYRYRLTTRQLQNGQWKATTIAVCELKVVQDTAGIPYDEVRWISKKTLTPKDTLDESGEAGAVKPYRISLHPKGRLPVPPIDQPGMTGPITDLNTFWVAISPGLDVERLHQKGDSVMKSGPLTGNFANGKTILKGEDYLEVKVRMTDETPQDVRLLTSFMPPGKKGLHYLLPEMNTPVIKDTLNNFQMVMPAGKDHVHVQYGREFFTINSTIRKIDGKLRQASMYNVLDLHLKLNCDPGYANCQHDMPFRIERTLELELLE